MNIITKSHNIFFLFIICIVTWLVYYNSLSVPFYLDDTRSISNNAVIHTGTVSDVFNTFGMRFFAYLSFWADYQIIGNTSPIEEILTQLHITSIIIHMLNGFLVFGLAYVLAYKTPNTLKNGNRPSNSLPNNNLVIFPLVCALLFIVHPLHSQAVTYIVQRTAALVSLFYLASLLSYLWLRLTQSLWQKALALFFTVCFAGFAFFTKQNSFTLPLTIILIELIFFNKLRFKHLGILFALSFLGLAIAYLVNSQEVTMIANKLDRLTRENILFGRLDYFLAQMNILWIYIGKFFIPYPIRLEYPYYIDSFVLWQSIISGVGHLSLIAFAFIKRKQLPLIAFGILFYYCTHLIESGVIPIKDLAFEHRTYLPNFGLILALFGGLTYAQNKWKLSSKYISLAFLTPVIIIFAVLTSYRNFYWQHPILFYQHELSLQPNNCRLLNNLANQYEIQGDKVKALELIEQCIKLQQGIIKNPEVINNYIALLIGNKQFAKASQIAIETLPFIKEPISRRIILENLGISTLNQKQYADTEKYLKQAILLPSPYPRTYFALAISLLKQDKNAEAKHYAQLGLKLQPNSKLGMKLMKIL